MMSKSIVFAAAVSTGIYAVLAQPNPHYPVYCKTNGFCHVPGLPNSCTDDSECRTPWYDSYCQTGGTCHLEPPPKCKVDSDCYPKNATTSAIAMTEYYTPVTVSKICVNNNAGFVLHFDMKDMDTDEISQDSGEYPIDQSKCLSLNDLAHVSENDLILCRVHAVAGETKDCTDAVKFSANSTETATFSCKGTTLDYSCDLEGL